MAKDIEERLAKLSPAEEVHDNMFSVFVMYFLFSYCVRAAVPGTSLASIRVRSGRSSLERTEWVADSIVSPKM